MEKYEENESRTCYCGNFDLIVKCYLTNVNFHKLYFLFVHLRFSCVFRSDEPYKPGIMNDYQGCDSYKYSWMSIKD